MIDNEAPLDSDDLDNYSGDERILKEAHKRWNAAQSFESTMRSNQDSDEKFVEGDAYNLWQWPGRLSNLRNQADRPMLTNNRTRQHCLQIVNDGKQNRPGIVIRPTGGGATYKAGQTFQAVIEDIEYKSRAEEVYDWQLEKLVKRGLGYIRLKLEYEQHIKGRSIPSGVDPFAQNIRIGNIFDPRNVYIDTSARERTGLDSRWGFIFDDMPRDVFREKYPAFKKINGLTSPIGNTSIWGTWITPLTVRVAEYYRKVTKKDRLYLLKDDDGNDQFVWASSVDKDTLRAALGEMEAAMQQPRYRDVDTDEVQWFLMAGEKIINRGIWPGRYIPIVRVVAEWYIIEGILDAKGHVRAMLDPQRMYNYFSPLSLETPLPTPTGWTTMGAVEAGDWLLDEMGQPVQVAGISPTHINRKCYRVTFDDGTWIDADADHRWTVEERGKRKTATWDWSTKTITTADLTPNKHFIYATKPVDLPDAYLPIDPYVLGVWLGDGATAEPRITSGLADMHEMRALLAESGYRVGEPRVYSGNPAAATIAVHGVRHKFSQLGLLGNKHIPAMYLRASRRQREALLCGLMDTDGSISKTKLCNFVSTNRRLAAGFMELLRTFGIKANVFEREAAMRTFPSGKTYQCQSAVQITFSADPGTVLFRLSRKASRLNEVRPTHPRRTRRHRIKSVVEIMSVPTKCVAINSASHLFLAGEGMIPTHNSAAVEYTTLQTKSPWKAPMEGISGLESFYEQSNLLNAAVIPYRQIGPGGVRLDAPQREAPPMQAAGYIEAMGIANQEMQINSGQNEATFGMQGNEKSGVALDKRRHQGDVATFHYDDALAAAIASVGIQCVDMIPRVYDTKRVIRIKMKNGEEKDIVIDPKAPQPYTEEKPEGDDEADAAIIFNPTMGEYGVRADAGPGYATLRQEAFNALLELVRGNPQLMMIFGDLMFRSADFPLADEMAERMKRMVAPQALGEGPTPDQQEAMQAIEQLQGIIKQMQTAAEEQGLEMKALKADRSIDGQRLALEGWNSVMERLNDIDNAQKTLAAADPIGLAELARQAVQDALTARMPVITPPPPPVIEPAGGPGGVPGVQVPPEAVSPAGGAPSPVPEGAMPVPPPGPEGMPV